MNLEQALIQHISEAITTLYGSNPQPVKLERTNPDFDGDYTFVVFPLLRISRSTPEATATAIGEQLKQHAPIVSDFNVVKGFLNIVLKTDIYADFLKAQWDNASFGQTTLGEGKKVMVEYSSPNTNKPLHLGHVRNNLLGMSVANLYKAAGYQVVMANLVNDRGIHICKSMLAWQKFGNGETPESTGMKGDHLVGKYYVVFENALREQTLPIIEEAIGGKWAPEGDTVKTKYQAILAQLQQASEDKQIAKLKDDVKELVRNQSPLMRETQQMLRDWEAGIPEVIELWKTMNGWVYSGFEKTYARLGVSFDQYYYESDTYKLGKDVVEEGLQKGVFYRKDDGSVWIDLRDDGLDEKLVLRGDGTSVYITQDIGTADLKFQQHGVDQSIYVVGNEQDYHFKVLFLIMKKLDRPFAEGMHHLSYGMVDLPSGKMKSREGTVVDADDLVQEMVDEAKAKTQELGKTDGLEETELLNLYESLGLSALKFFILKVDPRKRMLFNPQESIDFQGDTGPFVQYTYARIQSILRSASSDGQDQSWKQGDVNTELQPIEIETIQTLYRYPEEVNKACNDSSPAVIAQYCIDLARTFNRFYNECHIMRESDPVIKNSRLKLAHFTAHTLKHGLHLLGIQVVERM
ncbi:MAG: arginine--tRNA ligase [Sphingomonadales bacterium]|nr:arginine--tRNA ligase [Sphingomonadales bacterium]